MPGTVLRVAVEVGAQVAEGDVLLVLEAMKMEHAVRAPAAGTVTVLAVQVGGQVDAGTVLAVVEGSGRGLPDAPVAWAAMSSGRSRT